MPEPAEYEALDQELERLSRLFPSRACQQNSEMSVLPDVGVRVAPVPGDSPNEGSMNTMASDKTPEKGPGKTPEKANEKGSGNIEAASDAATPSDTRPAQVKATPTTATTEASVEAKDERAAHSGEGKGEKGHKNETPKEHKRVHHSVTGREEKEHYLLGRRTGELLPQGVEPLSLEMFTADNLNKLQGVEVVKTLGGTTFETLAFGAPASEPIHVCKMQPEHAHRLHKTLGQRVVIERDEHITLPTYSQTFVGPGPTAIDSSSSTTVASRPVVSGPRDPGLLIPLGEEFTVTFLIQGTQGPVARASVVLTGRTYPFPVQGVTDETGKVSITLYGESPDTLMSLIVRPHDTYYSLYVQRPQVVPYVNNVVTLTPLDEIYPNFPKQQVIEWGQRAMNLDKLPAHFQGQGARVAIIDSGLAVNHPDLHAKAGFDFVTGSEETWSQDTIGHGTHCAGIVAGNNSDIGIRGFAPEADVYAFKIFPGGRFSNLIEALDRCIELQIDVANLSLGSAQPSELVAQKILQAKQAGVACIVAAGNSAGPVQYPAAFPDVLAVAAIGREDAFPQNSYNVTQVFRGSNGASNTAAPYFSATFSCFGPEVDVAAPGVAIVSTVPPDKYATMDGTSMAAPHVTGLATLIIAHHPDFQRNGPYAARNALRVERLFQILRQSAHPLNVGDPYRVGVGMPDAVKALSNASVGTGALLPASVNESLTPTGDTLTQLLFVMKRIEGIIEREVGQ